MEKTRPRQKALSNSREAISRCANAQQQRALISAFDILQILIGCCFFSEMLISQMSAAVAKHYHGSQLCHQGRTK